MPDVRFVPVAREEFTGFMAVLAAHMKPYECIICEANDRPVVDIVIDGQWDGSRVCINEGCISMALVSFDYSDTEPYQTVEGGYYA